MNPESFRPWGYYALGSAVFSGAMLLGDLAQRQKQGQVELAAAVAEADRRLPHGWRWADIEKRRRTVPAAQNSALHLKDVGKQIGYWPGDEVDKLLRETEPQHRFSRADLLKLQLQLGAVKKPLFVARGFVQRPDGRLPIDYKVEWISTLLPGAQSSRSVANILRGSAIVRAETGDSEQAMADCRSILIMASWLREEPCLICQLIRIAECTIAANTVERVLAQTEPSAASLAALQKLVADDLAAPPPFRVGVEGELALTYRWLEAVRAGQVRFSLDGLGNRSALASLQEKFMVSYLMPEGEAKLVRMMARVAAATHKPLPEEQAELAAIDEEVKNLHHVIPNRAVASATGHFGDVLVELLMPAFLKVHQASIRHLANQRALLAMLAAERFRRDTGRWPQALGELVPKYLAAVPTDPYDYQPLRLKRTAEGLVIYSVGPDRKDNGGAINRQNTIKPGTDVGYRLWDVSKRRQPPPPAKPSDEDSP